MGRYAVTLDDDEDRWETLTAAEGQVPATPTRASVGCRPRRRAGHPARTAGRRTTEEGR